MPRPISGVGGTGSGVPVRAGPDGGGSRSRILTEDSRLEVSKLEPRLEPEVVDEHAPCGCVRLERVGLSPGAIERHEQLPVETLPVRALRKERFDLHHEPRMTTGGEVRVDSLLEQEDPQLVQASEFVANAARIRVGCGDTAPE